MRDNVICDVCECNTYWLSCCCDDDSLWLGFHWHVKWLTNRLTVLSKARISIDQLDCAISWTCIYGLEWIGYVCTSIQFLCYSVQMYMIHSYWLNLSDIIISIDENIDRCYLWSSYGRTCMSIWPIFFLCFSRCTCFCFSFYAHVFIHASLWAID